MSERTIPRLDAYLIRATHHGGSRLAGWCEPCEAVHAHSAAPGHRVAHCTRRDSPYAATGYDLIIAGEAGGTDEVVPKAPLVGRRHLWRAFEDGAPKLQAAILRAALGARQAAGGFDKRLGRTRIVVRGSSWSLDPEAVTRGASGPRLPWRSRVVRGRGLLRLLARLYGISPGIVAVRLLQAASGETLDARAWGEVAAAVDAWDGRQANHGSAS